MTAAIGRREALRQLGTASSLLLASCGLPFAKRRAGAADWSRLQAKVQGRVTPLGGVDYENVRRTMVWNARKPDRFPHAIVRASSEADISEAIRFARQHELRVAIRGGGHNWHNAALRQGGLLLDLSGLNGVRVDAARRTAAVQPGVKGRALIARVAPLGLAFPIGHCPDVSLSGFLLNGGLGWNYGTWGPSCASIEALDIVNAHGELVRADKNQNADLFWAARGAGPGFFGVVTQFHLRLFPLPRSLRMSSMNYRIEDVDRVAAWLPQLARDVPANVDWQFQGLGPSSGSTGRLRIVAWAFADTVADAHKALEAFEVPVGVTALRSTFREEVSVEDVFGSADAPAAAPPRYLGEEVWSNASPRELLLRASDGIRRAPSARSFLGFSVSHSDAWPQQPDMAFSRFGSTLCGVYGIWTDAAQDATNQAWVETTIASLDAVKNGRYAGTTDLTIAPERITECFSPAAWEKLVQLKRKYDPDDVFFSYLRQAK
jgi:FAD/FMN-containing dehydrogenase